MFSIHTWGRNLVMSDSREWLEFGVYLTSVVMNLPANEDMHV